MTVFGEGFRAFGMSLEAAVRLGFMPEVYVVEALPIIQERRIMDAKASTKRSNLQFMKEDARNARGNARSWKGYRKAQYK